LARYFVIPIKEKFWGKQVIGLLTRNIPWKRWSRRPNNSILLYGKRGRAKRLEIFYDEFDGVSNEMS
jgi:hypothetical protein